MMHLTKQTQQRTSMIVAIAGIAGLVFLNRAVSSTQQPKPSATSAAVASAPTVVESTPKPYQLYANNPKLASERVRQIAQETKGDWNKVSRDDKVLLNRMTQGHGREALLNMAQQQAITPKSVFASPSTPTP